MRGQASVSLPPSCRHSAPLPRAVNSKREITVMQKIRRFYFKQPKIRHFKKNSTWASKLFDTLGWAIFSFYNCCSWGSLNTSL